jgi:DNA-binding CsgD family transcriptional regulator
VPPVTNLSARDLEAVLGVVAEASAADGETPFELSLLDRFAKLVRADHAGYYEYLSDNGRSVFQVESDGIWDEEDVGEWRARVGGYLPHWPLNDGCLCRYAAPVRLSDFVSESAKRRNAWYVEVMRPRSWEHECKVLLPNSTMPGLEGNTRGFFFVRERGRRDFDERDRVVLTVLRSQLALIRDRWERRRRPPGLTIREAEIAGLLREGMTNQEIADRLVISTGTVRTHLENIFEKLEVHTRTAAVARAFGQAQLHDA